MKRTGNKYKIGEGDSRGDSDEMEELHENYFLEQLQNDAQEASRNIQNEVIYDFKLNFQDLS